MKLTVRNAGSDRKLFRGAIEFFVNQQMSPALSKDLQINLKIVQRFDDPHLYGYVDFDEIPKPKNFDIALRQMHLLVMLRTLAHEIVHVRQHRTGELRYYSNGDSNFHGKRYDKDLDYWECPWEIEAMGRERKLLKDYIVSINREELFLETARFIDLI